MFADGSEIASLRSARNDDTSVLDERSRVSPFGQEWTTVT
jgi:hypothetical protein